MNPEYKKEFDIPDHDDFQVAGKYNSQNHLLSKGWLKLIIISIRAFLCP